MGNVSLDVARMLLCPPEILEKYDVPNHVLEVLRTSQVKHVSVVGRRGPLEAAFTTKELREMMNLPGVALKPLSDNVLDVKPETRQQSRTLELLKKGSKERYGETQKSWSLKFYRDVMGMGENDIIGMTEDGIIGMGENNMRSDMRSKIDPNNLGHLPQLLLLHHTAVDPVTKRARLLVKEDGSPVASLHPTSLVITALGFHADPDSSAPYAQWYDSDTKHIKTLPGGRVSTTNLDSADPKIYASGWAATGAKGVLASTMMDAYSVADAILEDWTNHTSSSTDIPSTHIASSPWDAAPPEILRALSLSTSPPVMPFISGYHTEPAVTTGEKAGSAEGKERERMGWGEAKPFLKKLKERQGQGSKRNSSSNMNRSTHSP
ncbi:hypothetical protein BDP27DRAFT_1317758 [Rhodocollybia butyracea]|uniref:FAD/NAD(P)-binding domain-containing protein n=1 Tax=Rhodocollybia butyracea TaxID=206335 RepID=A0A9P5UD88_9AGAR|nr:hypothetical protein BDP27DRAFT_1317758 [Rhodocollybia butyracea]